jgi:hypothetical protein
VTLSASQYAVIAVSIAFGVVAIARFEMLCINDLSGAAIQNCATCPGRDGWC